MTYTISVDIPEETLLAALRRLSPEQRRQLINQLEEETTLQVVTIPMEQLEPLMELFPSAVTHLRTASGSMTNKVIMDTALVAAWLDTRDKWHSQAISIFAALKAVHAQSVFLDVVVSEVIDVLARRMTEQNRLHQFEPILTLIEQQIPANEIIWLSTILQRIYPEVLHLVRDYKGELNFNDAVIALGCRELKISYIASFDRDFDQIPWLKRIGSAADVPTS